MTPRYRILGGTEVERFAADRIVGSTIMSEFGSQGWALLVPRLREAVLAHAALALVSGQDKSIPGEKIRELVAAGARVAYLASTAERDGTGRYVIDLNPTEDKS